MYILIKYVHVYICMYVLYILIEGLARAVRQRERKDIQIGRGEVNILV